MEDRKGLPYPISLPLMEDRKGLPYPMPHPTRYSFRTDSYSFLSICRMLRWELCEPSMPLTCKAAEYRPW